MKRFSVFLVMVCVFAASTHAIAKNICLQDSFGEFIVLRGGKIDKKPYVGEFIVAGCNPVTPLTAVAFKDKTSGNITITVHWFNAGVSCNGAIWTMFGDKNFNATGTIQYPPFTGSSFPDTFTNVDCSSVPAALEAKGGKSRFTRD